MAITVFDAVSKFSADTSELDQFIVKLEQGLSTASDRAAASTRALKGAQEEFREAIKAVSAEGGNTSDKMTRLAEAEKNLTLASAANKQAHDALKKSMGDVKKPVEELGGDMMEARHSVMMFGEQLGVHIPRAVAGMIASFGPLEGILTKAFPILGALALIEIIGKLIENHEKYQETMRKAAIEAENLKITEEGRTSALEVANLRIEDQIKLLEGHPATNQLAIALREVQIKADELATSFAKDFQAMDVEVKDLNGLLQKFADYTVNAIKAESTGGLLGVLVFAKTILQARGQETEAVKKVQQAEADLERARLASHEVGTKDAAAQQLALGQQAVAAGNLQKAYDRLADSVEKVDPGNHELIEKLRNHAKSAEADWKDLGQEITNVGLVAKQTTEEQAADLAKRAQELSNITISGKEQMGMLDAEEIRQAGEQAYQAETVAIQRIVEVDTQGGKERAQAELDLIPRMQGAEKTLNDARLTALKSAHDTRIQALDAEAADILKYERGDDQLKALTDNQNKQNEETRRYELERQQIAAQGETKLTEIANRGVADRIAIQEAMRKAELELTKAHEELLKAETALADADISSQFKAQEQAIQRLAQFHLITEREKANRLAQLYQEESQQALAALERQLKEEQAVVAAAQSKLTAAQSNPFFSPAQLKELQANLDHAEAAVKRTESKIIDEKTQSNNKLLALDKGYYGEAVSIAVANGQKLLAQQLQENHASLVAAQQRLAEAKSRHENTDAISQEVSALKKIEQELSKEALGRKASATAIQNSIHAALLDAQAELAAAKARGQNTTAIEKQIKALQKLEAEYKKSTQLAQTDTKQQLTAWEQFFGGFQQAAESNRITLEQMGQEMEDDVKGFGSDITGVFQAAVSGQESFGQAMEEASAKLVAKMAQQWGDFFLANSIADWFWNPAKAAAETAAAVALYAVAGALGAVGSGGSSSSSSSSTGPQIEQSSNTQPAPVEQPVLNVTHLATGGIAPKPTLVVIGDSEHGGAQEEAVIPLENQRALDRIAAALVPALLRTIVGHQTAQPNDDIAHPALPRFAEGAIVTSPLLAMLGDSPDGYSATEGVFPLENQRVMEMITAAFVPGIVKALPAEASKESSASSSTPGPVPVSFSSSPVASILYPAVREAMISQVIERSIQELTNIGQEISRHETSTVLNSLRSESSNSERASISSAVLSSSSLRESSTTSKESTTALSDRLSELIERDHSDSRSELRENASLMRESLASQIAERSIDHSSRESDRLSEKSASATAQSTGSILPLVLSTPALRERLIGELSDRTFSKDSSSKESSSRESTSLASDRLRELLHDHPAASAREGLGLSPVAQALSSVTLQAARETLRESLIERTSDRSSSIIEKHSQQITHALSDLVTKFDGKNPGQLQIELHMHSDINQVVSEMLSSPTAMVKFYRHQNSGVNRGKIRNRASDSLKNTPRH